jgi:hypothetical protein
VSLRDSAESSDFDYQCLEDKAAFKWTDPWYIPVEAIRNYFGEKV